MTRKYPTPLVLPTTKRALRRMLHEAWMRGVWAAQDRLENEAERTQHSHHHHSSSMQEAADLLNGVAARGR